MKIRIDSLDMDIDITGAKVAIYGLIALLTIAVLIFAFSCWVIIPAGCVGVGDTFGTVNTVEFKSGLQLKSPIEGVNIFDAQTQKFETDDIMGLTVEGMQITVHVTVNYHIDQDKADQIYKTLGRDYVNKIVLPTIRGAIYDEIGKYTAEKLYTERNLLANPAKDSINKQLNDRGIFIETVIIRSIILPDQLKQAIEEKQKMEQNIKTKQYEVMVADEEAKRKISEARGIAEANQIIADSLSERYIQWYWIENVGAKNPQTVYVPYTGVSPVFNVK